MNPFKLRRRGTPVPSAAVLAGASAVEVTSRYVRSDGGFSATLMVAGYPAEVGPGWMEPLLSFPGRLDVSIHIEPVPTAVAAERLRKQRARLESSRRSAATRDRLDDPAVDAAAYDAAQLAGRVARGEGRLFRVGLYLTVHAATAGELADRTAQIRALAASMLLDSHPVTWRELQGWVTGLPLGTDLIDSKRTFDTQALAAAFPFTSPDMPAPDTDMAVLFGLNSASAGIVAWDRWAQDNHNATIMARSGAGKSYLAKLDLLRNLYLGVTASVIDPEDEYVRLAEAVGGTILHLGGKQVRFNPFDLPTDGGPDDALVRRAMFAHTVITVLLGNVPSPTEAAALDTAVMAAYHTRGITTDPRTWRRPAPLLADVTDALRKAGEIGTALAARLAPYVTGSFAGLFDGPTTTRPDGHLVVYAIKDLADEVKPVGTLLILDAIWRQITRQRRDAVRQLVLVDEAWMLLRDGEGAKFLARLAKSARKHNAGLTVVTQDAADVLSSDLGRAVISNSATQLLLRQAPQAIDAITDAFQLTNGERAFLLSAGQGDALLAAGTHRVAFHAIASDTEHELLVTGHAAHDLDGDEA